MLIVIMNGFENPFTNIPKDKQRIFNGQFPVYVHNLRRLCKKIILKELRRRMDLIFSVRRLIELKAKTICLKDVLTSGNE